MSRKTYEDQMRLYMLASGVQPVAGVLMVDENWSLLPAYPVPRILPTLRGSTYVPRCSRREAGATIVGARTRRTSSAPKRLADDAVTSLGLRG